MRQRLLCALLKLQPIYRLPVLLRDVQGRSTEEASAILRLNPLTVKSRLRRGRRLLRRRLVGFAAGLTLHRSSQLLKSRDVRVLDAIV